MDRLTAFLPIERRVMQDWKLDASHNSGAVKAAVDGNENSRYSTNRGMRPGVWFSIDMMKPHRLRQIILDTTKSGGDYPRGTPSA